MAAMPVTPGARLGAYEIVAPIGAGGMGEVYRAKDLRLGREVALKVLPLDVALQTDRLARFEREARMLASLNHPNIVVIHSFEQHESIRFLTMELVEGKNLSELITPGGLSVSRLLDLFVPLTAALVAAHEKGVIHRDLKPQNVMITTDGRVKVLDFGLAKLSEAASEGEMAATVRQAISRVDQVVGTVPYMAPEQIRGETVDARSDVFALGIMLYELATGQRPFTGRTPADISSAILRDTPAPLTRVRTELPARLETIVERCLEKEPGERAQSACEVLIELQRLAADASSSGRTRAQPTPGERPSLVVLPFANVSSDPENEYFSDGLTEEVIADLSRIEAMRVISRTSAMRFKGTEKDLSTVARELGVRYALEGSVRKAGNDIRITARLIDIPSETPLWSEKYAGTLEDVFAIQEKVSRSIAASLRVHLSVRESQGLVARPAPNAYAFDTYLRSRRDIWSFFPERMERARSELIQALKIVGDDPYLHTGLALVNWQYINAGVSGDRKYLAEAETHARKVLELDPEGASGPRLLGLICAQNGDVVGWLRHLQRAYDIDPHDAQGAVWTAIGWIFAGHPHRARPILEKLISVDPLFDYLMFTMGFDAYMSGDFERAEHYYQEGRRLSPDHPGVPMVLAQNAASAGQFDRAVRFVEEYAGSPESHPLAALTHIFKYALQGESEAADALTTPALIEKIWSDFQYTHFMAQAQAVLGRQEDALRWLGRAVERGLVNHPFLAERDSLLATLRPNERFGTLLEDVYLRWKGLEQEVDRA